jgi:hypothetical protein
MKKQAVALAAAAAFAYSGAPAFADGIAIEANGARAHGVWGGELGVGYDLSIGGFTLRPIAGAFIYQGDNDRYEMDRFSNGQERCRDLTDGQFSSDEKCDDTAVKAYAKVEATFTIPAGPEIGAGARFSSDSMKPYGTVSFAVAPRLRIKGNAGDDYYALGLRANF